MPAQQWSEFRFTTAGYFLKHHRLISRDAAECEACAIVDDRLRIEREITGGIVVRVIDELIDARDNGHAAVRLPHAREMRNRNR